MRNQTVMATGPSQGPPQAGNPAPRDIPPPSGFAPPFSGVPVFALPSRLPRVFVAGLVLIALGIAFNFAFNLLWRSAFGGPMMGFPGPAFELLPLLSGTGSLLYGTGTILALLGLARMIRP